MYLTLQIVRAPNMEALPQRSCTFGIEGGKIGRLPSNEWFIPFDYLHGLHATVRFYNGLFFIEKRGQHRVAVNSPDSDLRTDETYPIRDGDRVFLDEIEVSVKVALERPPLPPKAPAVTAPSTPATPLYADRTGPGGRQGGLLDPDGKGDSDIDNFLNFGSRAPEPSITRHETANHQSILHDSLYLAPETTSPSRLQPPGFQSQPALDEEWYKTQYKVPPTPTPSAPNPTTSHTPPFRPPPPPAPPAPGPFAAPMPPRAGDELSALLQALGLNARDLKPGEAEIIGRALRTAMTGVVSALQVRAEMRSRFRITEGRRADETLLESSANADDALHRFFRQRAAGTPTLDAAMETALQEIKFHEFALLDALRTTFERLIDQFNPETLQERMDETTVRARSMLGGKSRHWEAYMELYESISADREDFFRRFCAPEFASAYQKALEKYHNAARAKRRS